MKKLMSELKNKTTVELEKEIRLQREEIAKMNLEKSVHPQKDTNIMVKKRKKLAVMLTILTEKKELTKLRPKVGNEKI